MGAEWTSKEETAEQQRLESARQNGELHFRRLLEKLPVAAYTCDAEGLITYFNQYAMHFWGRAPKLNDPVDRFCGSLKLFLSDGSPISHDQCWMALALQTDKEYSGFEVVLERPDGRRLAVLTHASPFHDESGKLLGAVNIFVDISERKQAEEALRESHHRLEQALTELKETQEMMMQRERLAAVGQLAAGIAHDFNNILTGMLGYAELLHTSPDMPESSRADLAKVIVSGRRAVHLIRQILDFSRISAHQPQPLDIIPLIKEGVKFLEHTIPENILISLDIAPGTYMIEADPTQIHQMLINLAVNARDAMPMGGELQVVLSQVNVQNKLRCAACHQAIKSIWICLKIRDTGQGIPAEGLPHIFEPFYTTKEVGQGSGLGLAQVLGIVHQHAGHIVVDSRAGRETTFAIYLPPLMPDPEHQVEAQESIPICLGQGQTILVVEDEPAVLEAIEAMLQYLGYQVLTAANGREALAIYVKHQDTIALVLSDMTMPEMDGVSLFEALKTQNRDVRIVAMTGYPLAESEGRLLEQGVLAWVQKPLSLPDLSRIVGEALV